MASSPWDIFLYMDSVEISAQYLCISWPNITVITGLRRRVFNVPRFLAPCQIDRKDHGGRRSIKPASASSVSSRSKRLGVSTIILDVRAIDCILLVVLARLQDTKQSEKRSRGITNANAYILLARSSSFKAM